ncbi:MAG: OmpA family protein [Bacteroidales bacterium]|nr:OmpA family protein [Bacteroidales bacterium]MBN2818457.1 OmpA family protein [Bacteroidales bacterium]
MDNIKSKLLEIVSTAFLVIFVSYSTSAQIWIDNQAIYQEAEEYLIGEEYEEARPLYHLIEKRGIQNAHISYKIGLCLFMSHGDLSKTITYLEEAAKNATLNYTNSFEELNAPVESVLLLGRAYHKKGELEKAISTYERYKKFGSEKAKIQLADYYISECNNASALLKNPIIAKIEPLAASNQFSLYNPIITAQHEIFFMEKRKFYDAVVSAMVEGDSLSKENNITPDLGSDGNLFLCGSSADGNMLIFVSYNAGRGYDLYYSEKGKSGKFNKAEPFPDVINSGFNETSASVSNDGTLYFSSNRLGGYGGTDIYSSEKIEGVWSQPENLGNNVNSAFDEEFPMLSFDNSRLFFTSEGHLNMGGYDIFFSNRNTDNSWSKAMNVGSPVSTTADDNFISTTQDSTIFYTHRISPEFENRDIIYRVNIAFSGKNLQEFIKVSGNLIFNDTLPPKEVEYIINRETENKEVITSKTNKDGAYDFILEPGAYILSFKYNDTITASSKLNLKRNNLSADIYMESPAWNLENTMKELKVQHLEIQDILFEFNSSELTAQYVELLNIIAKEIKEYPDYSLEISGFTDALGTEEYNYVLSKRRAEFVLSYLVAKGIDKTKTKINALGEDNPIARNTDKMGNDLPEGRKYNRRVSLEINIDSETLKITYKDIVPSQLKD